MIPVFKPKMNKREILSELGKIFDSGWIGLGPKTTEFEEKFLDPNNKLLICLLRPLGYLFCLLRQSGRVIIYTQK
jgi:hypothetical protein